MGLDFNPLPRKEGDTKSKEAARQKSISIHSLVKRETTLCDGSQCGSAISIHSLVKRETPAVQTYIERLEISIHSLVKRETKSGTTTATVKNDFNPLPRKEGDNIFLYSRLSCAISIHSLVKRETVSVTLSYLLALEFQSTPS